MKIIYATSELNAWIDVARNMYKEKNWEPIYWITSPKNNLYIKQAFPNCICQGYIDAVRGILPPLNNANDIILDQSIIKQYATYEKIALKMMDRMDPTAYTFNLTERTQLYYELLIYWLNTIEVLKPDKVVFSESPHGLLQYILYAVCVETNIDILRFTPTHISGLTFLSSSIEKTPSYLQEAYEVCEKNPNHKIFHISDAYLEKNRKNYSDAIPYYMKKLTKKRTLSAIVIIYKNKVQFLIRNQIFTAYKRAPKASICENSSKLDLLSYKIKGYFFKKKLQKIYKQIAIKADLKRPYIYVALHYQPEKTSSPEGGIFVDQWLMIYMLSICVAGDWQIYVKEHSSQFSEHLYGEQGRNSDFYKKVLLLNNVHLIREEMNTFDLIDNSKAVATLTGTVGLESVIRSKPVLCFGHAWYERCHGVMNVTSSKDLIKYLTRIDKGYSIIPEKVKAFLHAIETISFPIYLNSGNKSGVTFDEEENIKNITTCLIQYGNKI